LTLLFLRISLVLSVGSNMIEFGIPQAGRRPAEAAPNPGELRPLRRDGQKPTSRLPTERRVGGDAELSLPGGDCLPPLAGLFVGPREGSMDLGMPGVTLGRGAEIGDRGVMLADGGQGEPEHVRGRREAWSEPQAFLKIADRRGVAPAANAVTPSP
jgi:hypothetical protein